MANAIIPSSDGSLNEWSRHILENRGTGGWVALVCSAVTFKDGSQLSVQASTFHQCTPRKDYPPTGGWLRFEVLPIRGMAREDIEALYEGRTKEWYENGWPIGWVPASVLDAIAERHGGIADGGIAG